MRGRRYIWDIMLESAGAQADDMRELLLPCRVGQVQRWNLVLTIGDAMWMWRKVVFGVADRSCLMVFLFGTGDVNSLLQAAQIIVAWRSLSSKNDSTRSEWLQNASLAILGGGVLLKFRGW